MSRLDAVPASLVALALALIACGGVNEGSDEDGSPGSETDAGSQPGSDGSPDGGSEGPAPVPDAAPATGCRDGVTPLLTNAGFEEAKGPPVGAIGWVEDPSPATYPQGQIPVEVPEGRRAALIGNAAPIEVRLTQPVLVPDATESLRLRYLQCIVTDEQEQTVLDTLQVLLLDEDGDTLEQPQFYTNLDAGDCPDGWTELVVGGIGAHAGEALQFQFLGTFSDGVQTSFYFDAVALDALGPCPE